MQGTQSWDNEPSIGAIGVFKVCENSYIIDMKLHEESTCSFHIINIKTKDIRYTGSVASVLFIE